MKKQRAETRDAGLTVGTFTWTKNKKFLERLTRLYMPLSTKYQLFFFRKNWKRKFLFLIYLRLLQNHFYFSLGLPGSEAACLPERNIGGAKNLRIVHRKPTEWPKTVVISAAETFWLHLLNSWPWHPREELPALLRMGAFTGCLLLVSLLASLGFTPLVNGSPARQKPQSSSSSVACGICEMIAATTGVSPMCISSPTNSSRTPTLTYDVMHCNVGTCASQTHTRRDTFHFYCIVWLNGCLRECE